MCVSDTWHFDTSAKERYFVVMLSYNEDQYL